MIFSRAMLTGLLLVVGSFSTINRSAVSQEDSPPPAQDAAFDPAEWQSLVKKKAEVVAQITEISKVFQTADNAKKRELAAEARKLQRDFQSQVTPRMAELAPAAFKHNPKDIDAAEIMMQLAYGKNRFSEAAEIADTVLKQDPKHALALNIGGVGHFARHEFEKSLELLETAKQNNSLYPRLGGQYLDSARSYIDYWNKEQQIRQQEAAATGDDQLPRVLMKTTKGDILLELFENEAPNTVANFVSLVESGYYDGIPFHRVIPAFMAQGGRQTDPATAVDYTIKCECYQENARRHFTGTLSMAHAGRDTGGAQFFITHLPTPHLDREIAPQSVHTVFGRVADGMDAVAALEVGDKILSATVVRKRDHEYKPVTQPAAQ